MKLISMTDFVFKNKISFDKQGAVTLARYAHKINNYAEFLKQRLTLGMFVPCDEEGNILEKPQHFEEWYSQYKKGFVHEYEGLIMQQYLKAKEKVLFEDFKPYYEYCVINEKHQSVYIDDEYCQNHTMEDLINHEELFSLTESAIKQIGL